MQTINYNHHVNHNNEILITTLKIQFLRSPVLCHSGIIPVAWLTNLALV